MERIALIILGYAVPTLLSLLFYRRERKLCFYSKFIKAAFKALLRVLALAVTCLSIWLMYFYLDYDASNYILVPVIFYVVGCPDDLKKSEKHIDE